MAHHITALVFAGPFSRERARELDLVPAIERPPITLMPIDATYSAWWAASRGCRELLPLPEGWNPELPGEVVIADLVREITLRDEPQFAIIGTEYFGGHGEQWAALFEGRRLLTPTVVRVNHVLEALGVVADGGRDAWDTIGLADLRQSPSHLARYGRAH